MFGLIVWRAYAIGARAERAVTASPPMSLTGWVFGSACRPSSISVSALGMQAPTKGLISCRLSWRQQHDHCCMASASCCASATIRMAGKEAAAAHNHHGGGTGGHVLARQLPELSARLARSAGWVPGQLRVARRPGTRFRPDTIMHRLRGEGVLARLLAPLRSLNAMAQAWRAAGASRRSPALRWFVTALAAWSVAHIRWWIHEQNAIPGMTNRLLARTQLFVAAFPGSFWPDGNVPTVGNPIRAEIASMPAPAATEERPAIVGLWRLACAQAPERNRACCPWHRAGRASPVRQSARRQACNDIGGIPRT